MTEAPETQAVASGPSDANHGLKLIIVALNQKLKVQEVNLQ